MTIPNNNLDFPDTVSGKIKKTLSFATEPVNS